MSASALQLSQFFIAFVVVYWYYTSYCCEDISFERTSIKDKRVLITGSSSGIGEQLAYEYSKLGAMVFLTARRANLLEEVAKKCKDLGAPKVEFVTADLGQQKARDKVMAEVKKRFGGLDHLVLNHAVISSGLWLGSKENMTTLMRDMNVNFISFVDLASQALPILTESKGHIGVVSSVAGKIAFGGSASYSTDKHAMQGFFSALRQELMLRNTGISVTTCVIGPVDTEMAGATKEEKDKMVATIFSGFNVLASREDTALAIIKGVTNREYEIYFGNIAKILVALHQIIPGFMESHFSEKFMTAFNIAV